MATTSGGSSSDRDRPTVGSRNGTSNYSTARRPVIDDDREGGDQEPGRQMEPGVEFKRVREEPLSARGPPTEDDSEEGDEEEGRQLEPGVGFERVREKSQDSSSMKRPATKDDPEGNSEEPSAQSDPEVDTNPLSKFYLIEAEEPATKSGKVLRHTAILALLAFSAIWGTLTREGLVALNTYSGMSIAPTIWAQSFGCLVMGWTVANRQALENWYPPMYIAISTGYCGSVTTFSTWILEVFEAFGNKNHYNRGGLHNVMDALTQTGATLGMSLISISAGMSLAHVLPARPLLHMLERETSLKRWRNTSGKEEPEEHDTLVYTKTSDLVSIIIGVLFWIASAILCGSYAPFRSVTFAIVLSPPGAILRWYLSRLNSIPRSKRAPFWPLGTLAANLLATAVISAVYVGQNVGRVSGRGGGGAYTINGCNALHGVQEGFCGCLSTISTFAIELRSLKPRRRAFGYVAGSWVIGIIICVLIIGSPWWSIGMDGSCKGVTL